MQGFHLAYNNSPLFPTGFSVSTLDNMVVTVLDVNGNLLNDQISVLKDGEAFRMPQENPFAMQIKEPCILTIKTSERENYQTEFDLEHGGINDNHIRTFSIGPAYAKIITPAFFKIKKE